MNQLNDMERGRLRNQAVGFVYQFHHLLPEFTALENVCDALAGQAHQSRGGEGGGCGALTRVGLAARLDHRPSQAVRRRASTRSGGPGAGHPA